jgi:hypothetical protein
MLVGTGRFELPTPRTPSECSTRLSHVPTQVRTGKRFEGVHQEILSLEKDEAVVPEFFLGTHSHEKLGEARQSGQADRRGRAVHLINVGGLEIFGGAGPPPRQTGSSSPPGLYDRRARGPCRPDGRHGLNAGR